MIWEWCARADRFGFCVVMYLFFSGCFGGSYFVLVSYFFSFYMVFFFHYYSCWVYLFLIIGFVYSRAIILLTILGKKLKGEDICVYNVLK